jgi:hypothetical protein
MIKQDQISSSARHQTNTSAASHFFDPIKQTAPRLKMGIFSSPGPKTTAARKTSTTSSSPTSVRALQARAFDVWNSRGSQSSQKADETGNFDQQRAKKHVVPERFAREVIVMRN